MENKDPIVEFLTQEENFHTAFKVAEYIQTITEDLHKQFWPHFHKHINNFLEASLYSEKWLFLPISGKNFHKRWAECFIYPKNTLRVAIPTLRVGFGQAGPSNQFRFYQGIHWGNQPEDVSGISQLTQLKEKLRLLDLTISGNGWPGWNFINYRARGETFLIRMANEPEETTFEIADGMWKLFLDFVPLLEAINKEIIDNYQATPA